MKLNKIVKTLLLALFLFSVGMNLAFLYNSKKPDFPRNHRVGLHRMAEEQRPMYWLKKAKLSEEEAKTFRQNMQKFEQECRIIELQSHELRRQLLGKIITAAESDTEIESIKQEILQKQSLLQDMTINFLKKQKEELGPEKQRNILELFMRRNYEPQRKRRRGRRQYRSGNE
jgi:hypothetical protein